MHFRWQKSYPYYNLHFYLAFKSDTLDHIHLFLFVLTMCIYTILMQNICSSNGKKPANHNIITVLQEKSDIDQNKFLQIDNHTSNKNVLLSYHITSTAGMQDASSGLIYKPLSILLWLSSSTSKCIVLDIMSLSTNNTFKQCSHREKWIHKLSACALHAWRDASLCIVRVH